MGRQTEPLNLERKKRIKDLQNKKKYTNIQIAELLSIPETTYKNLIRSDGNKNITHEILQRLSDTYECTIDYLLCTSDDPSLDKNGIQKQKPISFKERDDKLTEVMTFLRDNYETLNNFHFLLYKLPHQNRVDFLSTFNFYANNLRKYSVYGRSDGLSSEQLNFIEGVIEKDDPEYTKAMIHYTAATRFVQRKQYAKALPIYVKILLDAATQNHNLYPLAKKSLDHISSLKDWYKFPQQLFQITNELVLNENSDIWNVPKHIIDLMRTYLQDSSSQSSHTP